MRPYNKPMPEAPFEFDLPDSTPRRPWVLRSRRVSPAQALAQSFTCGASWAAARPPARAACCMRLA